MVVLLIVTSRVSAESSTKAAHRAQQWWWSKTVLHRPAGALTQRKVHTAYGTLPSYLPTEFEGRTEEREGLNLMSEAG